MNTRKNFLIVASFFFLSSASLESAAWAKRFFWGPETMPKDESVCADLERQVAGLKREYQSLAIANANFDGLIGKSTSESAKDRAESFTEMAQIKDFSTNAAYTPENTNYQGVTQALRADNVVKQTALTKKIGSINEDIRAAQEQTPLSTKEHIAHFTNRVIFPIAIGATAVAAFNNNNEKLLSAAMLTGGLYAMRLAKSTLFRPVQELKGSAFLLATSVAAYSYFR